jgi:glyoxylase-like metal-dependent hydrolase (beta-lactamase superfamily II)
LTPHPRFLNAGNATPFTLDGTRTFLVGARDVALIDPGPDVPAHVRALASAVEGAERVRVVLTHGHADHAGGARAVADATGAQILGPEGVEGTDLAIADAEAIETDDGVLIAVSTPGHALPHHCFHWPARRALFAGDLLLGRGDTTWVGEYPGCVADYLTSIERLRPLDLDVIYPAHGPPIEDPSAALDRYRAHRLERIEQVRAALARHPDVDAEELFDIVYGGTVPKHVRRAALTSLSALVEHVRSGSGA